MKIKSISVISFVTLISIWTSTTPVQSIELATIVTVAGIARMVVKDVLETWEFVDSASPGEEMDLPVFKHKHKKIFARLASITNKIDEVEKYVSIYSNYIEKLKKLFFRCFLFSMYYINERL